MFITSANAPIQQTSVMGKVTAVAPWKFWASVLAPIILAAIATFVVILAYRIANRSEGNDPVPKTNILVANMILGGAFGGVAQWGMQEVVSYITGVPVEYKMIVVAIMFTGPAAMLFYTALRFVAKWRKWDALYEYISVKHRDGIDYTRGDAPDMTVYIGPDDSEDTTDRNAT